MRNLAEAIDALRAAVAQGTRVILESPPGAGRHWGAPYFLALIAAARDAVPEAAFETVLDCGTAPGLAVEALRLGVPAVRIAGHSDAVAAVADIAAQLGGRVETAPRPEPAERR